MSEEKIKQGLVLVIDGLIEEAEKTKESLKADTGTFRAALDCSYEINIEKIRGLLKIAGGYLNPKEYQRLEDEYIKLRGKRRI